MRCSLRRHVPSDLFPPTSFPNFSECYQLGESNRQHMSPFGNSVCLSHHRIQSYLQTVTHHYLVTFQPVVHHVYRAVAEDHYGVDESVSHTDVDRCQEAQCAPHMSVGMPVEASTTTTQVIQISRAEHVTVTDGYATGLRVHCTSISVYPVYLLKQVQYEGGCGVTLTTVSLDCIASSGLEIISCCSVHLGLRVSRSALETRCRQTTQFMFM